MSKYSIEKQVFAWFDEIFLEQAILVLIYRFILEIELMSILEAWHLSQIGDHHSGTHIGHKILQCGYYWLIVHQDSHDNAKYHD